jgi:hypothetical protein
LRNTATASVSTASASAASTASAVSIASAASTKIQEALKPSNIVTRKHIETWSENPSLLFGNHGEASLSSETIFFDETVRLQERLGIDAVALRFRKLFYYDLLRDLNPAGVERFSSASY